MRTYCRVLRRMQPVTLLILSVVLAAATTSFAQSAGDRIVGTWTNETKDMEITFERCGDAYCALVTSLEGSEREDVFNPNPTLRDRPLVGLPIITGLIYRDGEWTGGTMYVPRKGIQVDVSLRLTGPEALVMTVRKLFLRRKAMWTRTSG